MDFVIKEEIEDSITQEVSQLHSIIETSEQNVSGFPCYTSEPVIEVPYSQQNDANINTDPLHTEEYHIVTLEELIVTTSDASRLITNKIPNIKTEVEEIDLEPDIEELPELPETTPCSVLLDTNEVQKYYSTRSQKFKFPSKSQQRKSTKSKHTPYKRPGVKTEKPTSVLKHSPSLPIDTCVSSPTSNYSLPASPFYQDSDSDTNNLPINQSENQDTDSDLKIQVKTYSEKILTCEVCNYVANKKDTLRKHYKRKHSNIPKYSCDYCKSIRQFNLKSDLKKHVLLFHMSKFTCKICNCKFTLKILLERHKINVHNNINCKIVGKSLIECNNKRDKIAPVQKHVQVHKNVYISHKCKICSYIINSKDSLYYHYKHSHPNMPKLECEFCKKQFRYKEELEKHIGIVHIHKYLCQICNGKFRVKSLFLQHKRKVHFNFRCKIVNCTLTSSGISNVVRTDKISRKTPYICHLCPYVTSKDTVLINHIKVMHKNPKNSKKDHKCRLCTQEFISTGILNKHYENMHSNITKFKCNFCLSEYKFKDELQIHIKKNHLINYKCQICYSTFKSKSMVIKHKNNIHFNFNCKIIKGNIINCENNIVERSNVTNRAPYMCHLCTYVTKCRYYLENHLRFKHELETVKQEPILEPVIKEECIIRSNRQRSKPKRYENYEVDDVIDTMPKTEKQLPVPTKPAKRTSAKVKKSHVCKACNEIFKDRHKLLSHYIKAHPELPKYRCDICNVNKIYRFKKDIKNHILTFHLPRYVCKICYSKFTKISLLKKHENRMHSNKIKYRNNEKIRCKKCDAILMTQGGLWKHIKNKHSNVTKIKPLDKYDMLKLNSYVNTADTSITCKFCDTTFMSYYNLKKHLNKKHAENIIINNIKTENCDTDSNSDIINNASSIKTEYEFKCSYCESNYVTHSGLQRHLINKHPDKLINETNNSNKITVMKSNTNNYATLNCEYCDFTFVTYSGLRKHVIKKHPGKTINSSNISNIKSEQVYTCELCNYNFASISGLQRHNKNLHLDKILKSNVNLVKCRLCKYTFISLVELQKHMKEKHVSQPKKSNKLHKCHICNVTYCDRDTLMKHYRYKHSTIPKFICNYCNKSFPQKKFLRYHISAVHLKKYECRICNSNYVSKKFLINHKNGVHFNFKCKIIKDKLINCESKKFEYDLSNCKNRYLCHLCPYGISTLGLLQNHLTRTHDMSIVVEKSSDNVNKNKIQCWKCEVCQDRVNGKTTLRKHYKRLHPNQTVLYSCSFCYKDTLITQFDLDNHVLRDHVRSPFFCSVCKIWFKDQNDLNEHDQLHDTTNVNNDNYLSNYTHYCVQCNLVFTNEQNYLKHQKLAHFGNQSIDTDYLTCGLCNTCHYTKLDLEKHIEETHLDDNCKFQCLICQKKCVSLGSLKDHLLCCHNNTDVACPYCEKYYKMLGTHIKRVHLDMVEYKCEICSEIFIGNLNLKKHMSEIHTVERFQRKCHVCKSVFPDMKSLKEHMRFIHNEIKPFLCHLCAYECITKRFLNVHLKNVHSNIKKPEEPLVKCPKCDKYYKKNSINVHITTAHKKVRFNCNICNKLFKHETALRAHKYYIHNIGYAKRHTYNKGDFECPGCFRKFKFEHTMINHYNREHVPCVCDICNRQLQGKHSMEKHLEYSHGMKEKVYPCKKCQHVALTPGRLQKHLVAKHNTKC